MWKIINEVIPTKKSSKTNDFTNSLTLDEINEHFVSTPQQMVNSFGSLQAFDNLTPRSDNTFSLPTVSENKVKEIIEKFDERKSVGSDGISTKLLKRCLFLVPFITFIIEKSFKDSKAPELWKIAAVKALHKSGLKNIASNLRPISVLPSITKIMEKILFEKLYKFLVENNLLSDRQFGFRAGHSCVNALLCLIIKIYFKKNSEKKFVSYLSISVKPSTQFVIQFFYTNSSDLNWTGNQSYGSNHT